MHSSCWNWVLSGPSGKEGRTFLGYHIYSLSPLLFWVSLVRRDLLPELAGWVSGQVVLLRHRDAWASRGIKWAGVARVCYRVAPREF